MLLRNVQFYQSAKGRAEQGMQGHPLQTEIWFLKKIRQNNVQIKILFVKTIVTYMIIRYNNHITICELVL